MRHLQELYAKYRSQGLVVLGINTSDAIEIATDLLERDGVEFPNGLDSSPEAGQAIRRFETLSGYSAVPMTYVIDREGKVIDAWYADKEGKAERILKSLELDEPE